ncbi:hypothetical protein C8R45DRAFT_1057192 [Mycena sanguinolenta]|nr:hypothetical protein C8R45DRAFT_1057192 [Mycena sanguinolenta]
MDVAQLGQFAREVLLNAFRTHYHRFETAVGEAVDNHSDAMVISRLGDDLDEFSRIVAEATIFSPEEFSVFQTSLSAMRLDLHGPGRPRIYIDPDFLRWAYGQRSTASISRYLGVGQATVRNALLEHGIAQPQENPFQPPTEDDTNDEGEADDINDSTHDNILDPTLPIPLAGEFPPEVEELATPSQPATSFTGPVSAISDDDLDTLLIRLRTHFRWAGLSMLDGMLRRLGHRVPMERLRQSLLRIDPVRRIFERIRIQRRDYHVLGPNSLWHHDGQHGLLSVHNVRIERLWVDVTAQVGATWADHFTILEIRHGLDINNVAHIWLLHFLFLGTINSQLAFFAGAWNQHRIQIHNSANRSPTDMFVFDMFVNGVRGEQLPPDEEGLGDEELEVYGIDWRGLQEDGVLHSQAQNNPTSEGSSSWVGCTGPPPDLSRVDVQPPMGTLTDDEALAYVRVLYPDVF